MNTLPAVTEPWTEKIERRHAPRPTNRKGGYEDYRACLRWEFDFYCAFCLCHESDLRAGAAEGTEGSGLFSIEHFILQEQEPALANAYENCFYACRYCNRARGRRSHLGGDGRLLLNPCAYRWADDFVREGDGLRPKDGHPDAQYTHEAYNLDSPIKRRARRLRSEKILDYEKAVNDYPEMIEGLRRKGLDQGDPELIKIAELLWETRRKIIEDTHLYLSRLPQDAQSPCPCKREPPASLRLQDLAP